MSFHNLLIVELGLSQDSWQELGLSQWWFSNSTWAFITSAFGPWALRFWFVWLTLVFLKIRWFDLLWLADTVMVCCFMHGKDDKASYGQQERFQQAKSLRHSARTNVSWKGEQVKRSHCRVASAASRCRARQILRHWVLIVSGLPTSCMFPIINRKSKNPWQAQAA